MDYSDLEQYWIWLSSIEGIGTHRMYRLIAHFENARAVWENYTDPEIAKICGNTAASNLRKAHNAEFLHAIFAKMANKDITAITRLSDQYPEALANIQDPPPTLFYRGNASCLKSEKAFSIVGSRRATAEGRRTARSIAQELSTQGVTIVSGLAAGIDSEAHLGALAGKAPTIAVLGCGVDIVYPTENAVLADSILEHNGLLLSEYGPGTPPMASHFPPRNRIISGLTRGVLLVEGMRTSGGMITINYAGDQGRDIFAVPGSIYASMSQAPNQLLVDGAAPVLSAAEILTYYHWGDGDSAPVASIPQYSIPEDLNPEERSLVEILLNGAHSLSEIQEITELSTAKLNSHLTMLEIRGIIVKSPGGMYGVDRPSNRA